MASERRTDPTTNVYVYQWLNSQPTDFFKYCDVSTANHPDNVSVPTSHDAPEKYHTNLEARSACTFYANLQVNVKAQQKNATEELFHEGQRQLFPAHSSRERIHQIHHQERVCERMLVAASEDVIDVDVPVQTTCLTGAVTAPVLTVKQNHDVVENLRANSPPDALRNAEKKYQRQPRRRTREGKYDPTQQPSTEHLHLPETRVAPRKRSKCSAAPDREFSAPNIKSARVTLKRSGPGMFNKTKSSTTVHGRDLPDLTFSKTIGKGLIRYSMTRDHEIAATSKKADRASTKLQHHLGRKMISSVHNTHHKPKQEMMSKTPKPAQAALQGTTNHSILSFIIPQRSISGPALGVGIQTDLIAQPPMDAPPRCKQAAMKDSSCESFVTWSASPIRHPGKDADQDTLKSFESKAGDLSPRNNGCEWPQNHSTTQVTKPCSGFGAIQDSKASTFAYDFKSNHKPTELTPVTSLEDLKLLANSTGGGINVDGSSQRFQAGSRIGLPRAKRAAGSSFVTYSEKSGMDNPSSILQCSPQVAETLSLQHDFDPVWLPNSDKFTKMDIKSRSYRHTTGAGKCQDGHMHSVNDARPVRTKTESESFEFDAFDIALLQQTKLQGHIPMHGPHQPIGPERICVEIDDNDSHFNSSGGQNKASAHGPPWNAQSCQPSHATAGMAHAMTTKDACSAKTQLLLLRPSLSAPDDKDRFVLFSQPHFAL